MTERGSWGNQCRGKIPHQRKASARAALAHCRKNSREPHLVNIYRCPYCGSYHVGHRTKRKDAKR